MTPMYTMWKDKFDAEKQERREELLKQIMERDARERKQLEVWAEQRRAMQAQLDAKHAEEVWLKEVARVTDLALQLAYVTVMGIFMFLPIPFLT